MRTRVTLSFLLVLTFFSFVPSSDANTLAPIVSQSAHVDTSVTLGFQGPLTGDAAQAGQSQLLGVKYAISQFKVSHPSININLLSFDDQGVASVAPSIATAAIASQAIGIVGPSYSGAAISSFSQYKAAGMPLISPSASRDSLSDPTSPDYGGTIFHRLVSPSLLEGKYIADLSNNFISNSNSGEPVIVASDNSSLGNSMQQVVQDELGKLSLLTNQTHTVSTTDYSNFSRQIVSMNPAVFVYTGLDPTTAGLIYKKLKEAGYARQFISSDFSFSPNFITASGATSSNGAIVLSPTISSLADVSPTLETSFSGAESANSTMYTAEAIDATNIFLSGIAAGNLTRSAMNNYVSSFTGTGLAGNSESFTSSGDPTLGHYAQYEVKDGKFIYRGFVQPVSFSTQIVTETFTIQNASTTPIPNANIELTPNQGDPIQGITDSNGQVKLSFPCAEVNTHCNMRIIVEPPISDLVDAAYSKNLLKVDDNQNTNITLVPADTWLNIFNPDSTAADTSTVVLVTNPKNGISAKMLRMGRIGLSTGADGTNIFSSTFTVSTNYHGSQISNDFSVLNVPPKNVHTIYSTAGSVSPDVSNTFSLTLVKPNLKIKVVDPNNLSTNMANAGVDFLNTYTGAGFGLGTDQNGTVEAAVPDGTWMITVNPPKNTILGSNSYSAVFADGALTTLSPDPVSSVDGIYQLALSQPDISGTISDPSGHPISVSSGQGFSVNLQMEDQNGNWYYLKQGNWSTGTWGFTIPKNPGTYRVIVQPYGFSNYSTAYSPTITVASDLTKSIPSGGSLTSINISLNTPNLRLKIVNPLDNSLMNSGGVEIMTKQSQSFVVWLNVDPSNPGLTGTYLEDGTYTAILIPPSGSQAIPGLAQSSYTITVTDHQVTVNDGASNLQPDGTGLITLKFDAANIVGRVLDGDNNPVGPYSQNNTHFAIVGLQTLGKSGYWNYTGDQNSWTSPSGYFSLANKTPGTYRVVINPINVPGGIQTFSDSFQVTAETTGPSAINLGDIHLATPNLRIKVRIPGGTADIPNVGVNVFDSTGSQMSYMNTGNAGEPAGFNFTAAGKYKITLYPPQSIQTSGYCSKTYSVTVSLVNGVLTPIVDNVRADNGVVILNFASATLRGHVYGISPSSTGVLGASVVPIDISTGQQLWQYAAYTDNAGGWAMTLPSGNYNVYAHGPWNSLTLGNSDLIGAITVDNSGIATSVPSPATASAFNFNLNEPTWSGVIKGAASVPGDPGLFNVQLCINLLVGNSWGGTCSQSDTAGRWALSAPPGFTSFNQNSNFQAMQINGINGMVPYTGINAQGSSPISALGFSASGNTGLVIRLPSPNTSITVTAGGHPVPYLWVNINKITGDWLGNAQTDSNGVAHFHLSDLTKGFDVRVDTYGNPTATQGYSSIMQEFSDSTVNSYQSAHSNTFAATIALPTPNVKGIVHDPYTGGVSPNSYVYLVDAVSNQYITGSTSDRNGFISLYAQAPALGAKNYTMYVYPQSNDITLATERTYSITVTSSGQTTVLDQVTGAPTASESYNGQSVFSILLAAPSVLGNVTYPIGVPAANSWVQPQPLDVPYWQPGAVSNHAGKFGLSLPDGHYSIQANVPWNDSSVTNSAQCYVHVDQGAVANTPGGCVQTDHSISLGLRNPNLILIIKDSNGNNLPNTFVSAGTNGWWGWSQTDADGVAHFFVDEDQMKLTNPQFSGKVPLYISAYPPQIGPSAVPTNCFSLEIGTPCADLPQVDLSTQSFPNTSFTLQMSAPNIKLSVKNPDGSASGTGNWVSLYAQDADGNQNWIAGSNTDDLGNAFFNVDTSSFTKFTINIEPNQFNHEVSTTTLTNAGNGYLLSEINNQSFRLNTPNLTIASNAKTISGSTIVNSWGWFGVERLNPSDRSSLGWIRGQGLDQNGSGVSNLAPSSEFVLHIYPGPNRVGAQTDCIVTTDSGGVVSILSGHCAAGALVGTTLTLDLDKGNVYGKVVDSAGNPVVNAIVYAQVTPGGNDQTAIVGTTDSNGNYGLTLSTASVWIISIVPFNDSNAVTQLTKSTGDPFTPTSMSAASVEKNFQLSAK
jgi:branched-chain amino acid transport system substrate-binding protein